MEPDTIIEMQAEERVYNQWVRERKNQILSMTDSRKKQVAWNVLFPKFTSDDNWMLDAKVW